MPELGSHGSVRGARGNSRPYRESRRHSVKPTPPRRAGRRGVVKRITANKATAIVLWDGRKPQDYLPIRSIELEPAELGTGDPTMTVYCLFCLLMAQIP